MYEGVVMVHLLHEQLDDLEKDTKEKKSRLEKQENSGLEKSLEKKKNSRLEKGEECRPDKGATMLHA